MKNNIDTTEKHIIMIVYSNNYYDRTSTKYVKIYELIKFVIICLIYSKKEKILF